MSGKSQELPDVDWFVYLAGVKSFQPTMGWIMPTGKLCWKKRVVSCVAMMAWSRIPLDSW